jgi:hypothetical protein
VAGEGCAVLSNCEAWALQFASDAFRLPAARRPAVLQKERFVRQVRQSDHA